jgi:hypothetical protein
MKTLAILCVGLLLVSCESKMNCSISDYLGAWKGTYECDTFLAENINIKLTEINLENQIKIEGTDLNDEILNFSDCAIFIAKYSPELSYKITGELNVAKNILTLRKESTSNQGIIFCTLILIR